MNNTDIENHPVFASFVARVLELLMDLDPQTLTYHMDMDIRYRVAGWTYYPVVEREITP